MSDATTPTQEKREPPGFFYGVIAVCLVLVIAVIILGGKFHTLRVHDADIEKQLAQAKTDDSQNKAALDKAKTDSAQLQSQLSDLQSKEADLRNDAQQSKDASNELKARLDKDASQLSDLQGQVERGKALASDLQNQLNQAHSGSAQLLSQLDQEKIHSMDLQSKLQKAQADVAQLQPMVLKSRHMPVTTSVEHPFFGGYTLHINNLDPEPLDVTVDVNGGDNPRTQTAVIENGSTLNVPKLEPGQTVSIASQGFETLSVPVK